MGYSLIERSIRKIKNNIVWPLTASIRRKKLNNTDFTIISNNCWGGCVYEDILSFADATRGKKRVILTKREIEGVTDCTVLSSRACGDAKSARSENEQISDDTFYSYKEINLIDLINSTVLPILPQTVE